MPPLPRCRLSRRKRKRPMPEVKPERARAALTNPAVRKPGQWSTSSCVPRFSHARSATTSGSELAQPCMLQRPTAIAFFQNLIDLIHGVFTGENDDKQFLAAPPPFAPHFPFSSRSLDLSSARVLALSRARAPYLHPSLPPSFSLSRLLARFLSRAQSLALSLSCSFALALSLALFLSRCLSLSLCLSVSVAFSHTLFLSLPPSLPLSLSLPPYLSLSLSLSLSHSLPPFLSHVLSLSRLQKESVLGFPLRTKICTAGANEFVPLMWLHKFR
jgi:hypothetical protein